jgi:hypothetical protein
MTTAAAWAPRSRVEDALTDKATNKAIRGSTAANRTRLFEEQARYMQQRFSRETPRTVSSRAPAAPQPAIKKH